MLATQTKTIFSQYLPILFRSNQLQYFNGRFDVGVKAVPVCFFLLCHLSEEPIDHLFVGLLLFFFFLFERFLHLSDFILMYNFFFYLVFLTVARQNWFKLVKLIQSVIASYFAISDFLFGIPHSC